jgi:hypothetical protein
LLCTAMLPLPDTMCTMQIIIFRSRPFRNAFMLSLSSGWREGAGLKALGTSAIKTLQWSKSRKIGWPEGEIPLTTM